MYKYILNLTICVNCGAFKIYLYSSLLPFGITYELAALTYTLNSSTTMGFWLVCIITVLPYHLSSA